MESLDAFVRDETGDEETRKFAHRLILGASRVMSETDSTLRSVTRNWDLKRMAAIDRNILRMAIFELLHCPDIPPRSRSTKRSSWARSTRRRTRAPSSTASSTAFVSTASKKSAKTRRPCPTDTRMVLGKLFAGLRKTRERLSSGLARLVSGRKLDEDLLDELEEVLYTADLGPTGSELVDELKEAYRRKEIRETAEVLPFLRDRLLARLDGCQTELTRAPSGPTVIVIVGVNGSGKTTSIAKLANRLVQQGHKVLLGAGDTFRAAAVEQLTLWSERLGIEIIKQQTGADPAAVAFDAVSAAVARDVDYLILDTAGRLHTQKNLMEELRKIVRVVKKQVPDAPHETLLVLDATTGQNAIRQAQEFSQAADVSGAILAKMDGTAKGGAVLGIRRQLPLPIAFIGIGEGIDDLLPFSAEDFVDAILALEATSHETD